MGIYQRLDLVKKRIKSVISNSVLTGEAKPVKSWITENIANFQIKLIRRFICCNKFYKVWKFHVRTTKLRNFIKVWKWPISILLLPLNKAFKIAWNCGCQLTNLAHKRKNDILCNILCPTLCNFQATRGAIHGHVIGEIFVRVGNSKLAAEFQRVDQKHHLLSSKQCTIVTNHSECVLRAENIFTRTKY